GAGCGRPGCGAWRGAARRASGGGPSAASPARAAVPAPRPRRPAPPSPARARSSRFAGRQASGPLALPLEPGHFLPEALQVLLEGDHLELAADDHLLELLEVQELLLQLGLGLLEVAHHLLVGAQLV